MAAKAKAKPVKKSRKPSAKSSARVGVVQPHGGMLIPGAGGGPQPGSGRPPNEFKDWCKSLLDDATNRQQVELVLADRDHPAYKEMWKAVADRAHGKPTQAVELTGKDGGAVKTERTLRWGNVEIPL